MKIILIICCINILYSCNSNKNEQTSPIDTVNKVISTTNIKAQDKLKNSNLIGTWIVKAYLDSLKVNMSSFKSSKFLESINTITIDTNQLKDRLNTILAFNSEALDAYIFMQNNTLTLNYKFANEEMISNINVEDSILSLNYNRNNLKFLKFSNNIYKENLLYPVNLMTNKILFKNNIYRLDNSRIKFNENGTVENFKKFTEYRIVIEYSNDPNPCDKIILKSDNDQEILFHYKFENNFFELYEIQQNDMDETMTFKLTYKLKMI